MNKRLGTLRRIDLRTIWSGEASDFTPWLAEPENIAMLGQAVGIELEMRAQEKRVGLFRADILCKDVATDTWVLIENQLARSDHGHLGQLLTYAAGLDTATVIWVAPEFCAEHRAALHWLNKITAERFNFFAVQVEAWAISGSLPAPRFIVAAGPNNWNPSVRKATREVEAAQSESAKRRQEYWQTFLSNLELGAPNVPIPSPNTLGNLRFNLQGRDLWITVYAASSTGHIGVFLRGSSEYRARLVRKRREIEADIGERAWNDDGDSWSVAVSTDADPTDRSDWARQHKWLAKHLAKFVRVFQPYVADR